MSEQAAVAELIHRAPARGLGGGSVQHEQPGHPCTASSTPPTRRHIPCLVGVSMGTVRYAGLQ